MTKETAAPTAEQSASTVQQQNNPPTVSDANAKRLKPNLPRRFLLGGPRENYLKIGVPLYEASIKCDWKAAKVILDEKPDLMRYSITENGETALHVAASAKAPIKSMVDFVKNLVALMKVKDLELENENFNTALYLAAVAGNVETAKIMVEKNRALLTIPGAGTTMMPLYAAALFGHSDVVKYLYANSNELCDTGWDDQNRRWLLEKCVENDMFDVALEIVKKYPGIGGGIILGLLARKPEAFHETKFDIIELSKHLYSSLMCITSQSYENKHPEPGSGSVLEIGSGIVPELGGGSSVRDEDLDRKPESSSKTKSNILWRTIKSGKHLYSLMFITNQPNGNKHPQPSNGRAPEAVAGNPTETKSVTIGGTIKSVFAFIGPKKRAHENESKAMQLLRIIWEDIAKKPKNEIDRILRGKPDTNMQDKSASGKVVHSGRVVQAMQLQKLISDHLNKLRLETQNILSPASEKVNRDLKLRDLISESLVKMHAETQNIIRGDTDPIRQHNKPISGKSDQALELQKLISEQVISMHDETQKIIEIQGTQDQVLRLQKVISRHIDKLHQESQRIIRKPAKETYSSRVLFIAAEMGNTDFLIELIRRYPDLIWKVNDNNQTIFHIAVKHRHEGIYNLLYEIGAMKDMITPLKDEHDNNMLHLVGKSAKKKQLQDVSGVALQMQRELLWFEEVRQMIPPSYRERKNEDDLTPYELFTKEHKELVTQGEKWMKGTANQCMVVAALIATIVFAAAFTVPGGYNQDTGIPFFKSKATFMVFVVADAISLFSSSASILIFLSILTSRYAQRDFLESLPRKLVFGLLTLFLSITTMTLAFSVSFFVLYNKGLLWVPILIGVIAVMPVFLYLLLQYGLFYDVIFSTYRSRYLFKPKKPVLYYETPKV